MTASFSSQIGSFTSRLMKLGAVPKSVTKSMEALVEEDLKKKFSEGKDAYGDSWKLRKQEPKDGHPILDASGALKRSRTVRVADDGELVIEYDDFKAVLHQEGTVKMPARPVVPTTAQGMPKEWSNLLLKGYKKAVEDIFR